jgi:hypothetical protein
MDFFHKNIGAPKLLVKTKLSGSFQLFIQITNSGRRMHMHAYRALLEMEPSVASSCR